MIRLFDYLPLALGHLAHTVHAGCADRRILSPLHLLLGATHD